MGQCVFSCNHFIIGACNPNFIDSDGYNCTEYIDLKYCTSDRRYGERWQLEKWGHISEWSTNGYNAWSCPECGCKGIENNYSFIVRNIL